MTSTAPRVWTDAMTLRAMSLIDNDGLSYEQVATIMARETGVPMTRSTISSVIPGYIGKETTRANSRDATGN